MKLHMRWVAAGILMLAAATPALAAIEGVADTCPETGTICFWQQPKVDAPPGWERRDAAGVRYRAAAFAPAGKSFADAPAVMYAKAVPKQGHAATLQGYIAADLAEFRKQYGDLGVQSGLTFRDGDGHVLSASRFTPASGSKAQWETVAYGEEGG